MNPSLLIDWVRDARRRTRTLIDDLSDAQLLGPRLSIVNPLLWEIGHVAWFQERWVLRHLGGQTASRADADTLYDSAAIAHDTRWDLRLPTRNRTLAYMKAVEERVLERIERGPFDERLAYFVLLSVFHEDMHDEAFLYTRQTLDYPRPRPFDNSADPESSRRGLTTGPLPGDVAVPGGVYQLGSRSDEEFVFDNEKWAHPVEVEPFSIARAPVTQQEFLAFVANEGYARRGLWSEAGWNWRRQTAAAHPVHWRREGSGPWLRRDFEQMTPLEREPHRPVLHVNWFEADAYCRWAGRRLPTEAEWELAASGFEKRRFPWTENTAESPHAALDGGMMGCVDVAALESGESWCGCRQMIGNVWEWTASDFLPYPGFAPDPYTEYSQPWFRTHKVLRGGCWATRQRLIRNTWRNFYTPDRRDVWSGFRTCALEP